MDEQALRKMSTEVLTDIKEWRRAHPRATYVEIEDEVHKRMMQLEAQIIESGSTSGTWKFSGKESKGGEVFFDHVCDTSDAFKMSLKRSESNGK